MLLTRKISGFVNRMLEIVVDKNNEVHDIDEMKIHGEINA